MRTVYDSRLAAAQFDSYYDEQSSKPQIYNDWVPEGHNYTLTTHRDELYYRLGHSFGLTSGERWEGSGTSWGGFRGGSQYFLSEDKSEAMVKIGSLEMTSGLNSGFNLMVKKSDIDAWMASHPNDSGVIIASTIRTSSRRIAKYSIKWYFPHEMPAATTSVTETNPVLAGTNNLILPVSKKNVQVSSTYSMSNITGVTVSVSTASSTVSQAASSSLVRTLLLDTTKINQSSLNGISNPKILVDIHDSRGRTSRFELSFPYYRYIPPEVLSFEASRDKDTATEIYAKSVVSLVSIPDYSVSLEYSINDSPYSMASFVNADRGFLTSLPLGEAFAIKLRLTDNYGFSKIYDNLAVSHSDIMEIYHDRIVFKVPVYDKEGNKVF